MFSPTRERSATEWIGSSRSIRTRLLTLGFVAVTGVTSLFAATGCVRAAPPASVATTRTTAAPLAPDAHARTPAHAELSAVVRAEDDDPDDDPRGTLIIHGDVVESCAALRSMHAASNAGEATETMAWLAIMKSVASCMTSGELEGRHVALHGPSRAQVIVRYVFTRLGVDEGRVDLTRDEGAACDDDCDASERRVEIGLAAADTSSAAASLASLPRR